MISCTSASEDPWGRLGLRGLALGLLLALGVLLLGLGLVRALAQGADNPRAARAIKALEEERAWVVLGNSVALSVVDSQALAQQLGVPAIALAGVEGALGPHAAAMLRHHPVAQGAKVVVLMPEHNLLAGRLPSEGDRALLVDLLTHPDPALTGLALGGEISAWDIWARDRQLARDQVMGAATRLPLSVLGLFVALPPQEGDVMARLGEGVKPNAAQQGATPVQAPAAQAQESEILEAPNSVLPLMLEVLRPLHAQLIVVYPADRRALDTPCRAAPEQPAARWMLEQGVAVVDLRGPGLSPGDFSREYHVFDAAKGRASQQLGRGLLAAKPGSYWSAACAR